eukprot:3808557-Rhodomonas_salina.1
MCIRDRIMQVQGLALYGRPGFCRKWEAVGRGVGREGRGGSGAGVCGVCAGCVCAAARTLLTAAGHWQVGGPESQPESNRAFSKGLE